MVDALRVQAATHGTRQFDAIAAEVSRPYVVAAETIILRPGIKQQPGVTGADFTASPVDQELLIQASDDPGYVAVVKPGCYGKVFLQPPSFWV